MSFLHKDAMALAKFSRLERYASAAAHLAAALECFERHKGMAGRSKKVARTCRHRPTAAKTPIAETNPISNAVPSDFIHSPATKVPIPLPMPPVRFNMPIAKP